jgi:hypothetical protein
MGRGGGVRGGESARPGGHQSKGAAAGARQRRPRPRRGRRAAGAAAPAPAARRAARRRRPLPDSQAGSAPPGRPPWVRPRSRAKAGPRARGPQVLTRQPEALRQARHQLNRKLIERGHAVQPALGADGRQRLRLGNGAARGAPIGGDSPAGGQLGGRSTPARRAEGSASRVRGKLPSATDPEQR